eukprot:31430-Pelagococcus_subviridis.AAC.7
MDVDAGGEWLWGADAPGGNSGSGGYLDAVFRHAAKVLHGVDVTGPLKYATPSSRNLDLKEVTLEVDGAVVLRFAAAYGFRNIQNIVRKCKAGSVATGDAYDFVEIMACPSGCLNGGGQLPPPPRFEKGLRLPKNFDPNNLPPGFEHLHASNFMTARDLVDRLDEIYRGEDGSGVVAPRAPGANPFAAVAYGDGGWVGGGVGSERARRLFHTRYHDRKAEAEGASGAVKAARDIYSHHLRLARTRARRFSSALVVASSVSSARALVGSFVLLVARRATTTSASRRPVRLSDVHEGSAGLCHPRRGLEAASERAARGSKRAGGVER